MKTKDKYAVLATAMACALALVAHAAESDKEKQQKEIWNMALDTLQQLYKAEPKTKAAVSHAAGYAVFSNLGVKILMAGSGKGKGIAVNNKSKHETFMKMLKKFRVVFLFDNEKALDSFVNSGWQLGGQSTAAAKTGDKGGSMTGAASVSEGVWMLSVDGQRIGRRDQRHGHQVLQGW
jgi:lipid-binding SYLF domain-containing protein